MSAFDKQEGGDHYKHLAIQPAEYCQRNRLGFMESCVVKYVTRHGSKNGAADLRKAIHFLELLLELEYPDVPRGTVDIAGTLEKHADEAAANVAANNELLREWEQGEKRMDVIGQNGNTGEHYSQWLVADPDDHPAHGPFDVIQVRWHDGTHSAMLPGEFRTSAVWSDVMCYRVIPAGTDPEDFPLPEPILQWGGSRYGAANQHTSKTCEACRKDAMSGHTSTYPEGACPHHSGPHSHTWPIGAHTHTASGPTGDPAYLHSNGVGIIAGIASAVSGVNIALGGAAASINS